MTGVAKPHKRQPAFLIAAVGILLLAFFFRFYHLADYPRGLFFDPAINGLDAVRLMERGGHVLFFPTNGGRESLFIYLLIPFIWLFDTTPFAIRLVTASAGLLTVAFLMAFLSDLRLLTRSPRPLQGLQLSSSPALQSSNPAVLHAASHPHPRLRSGQACQPASLPIFQFSTLSLLAGLVLATLYWHIAVSRLGQRPIMVPLLAVPLFWFLLKGWTTGRKRWFVLSGILLGLAGYTYSAARLLPVILGLSLLPELFWLYQNSRLRYYISRLLLFVAAAAVVYLPMAGYLLNHPAQFTERAASVMVWNFLETPTDIAAELGRNAWRVAGFFCCTGSSNAIFGLPGYPGLSPWLAPFLLLGLGLALRSWRQLFYRLIAVWWLIGVMPSIVAIEAPHPLRMIVAIPPTAILVGLGLTWASVWLEQRLGSTGKPRGTGLIPALFPLLVILLTLPGLWRAYYLDWGRLSITQGIYDYGAVAIRDAILQADPARPVYLPQPRFNAPTLLYYLSGHYARQAELVTPPAESALVISTEPDADAVSWVRLYRQSATVLPPLTVEGQALIQTALAGPTTPIQTPRGETVARIARLESDPAGYVEQPARILQATFGPLRLAGATYPVLIDRLADVPVTLYWQAAGQTSTEYETLVRLVDDARQAVGRGDARPTDWVYPTSFWRPSQDEVGVRHIVTLERGPLAPGRYWLAVSVLDPGLGALLPLTGGDGNSPDTLYLGPLKVALPPPLDRSPTTVEANFGDSIRLDGFSLDRQTAVPGDSIRLDLLWETLSPPSLDYTVFLHLLGPNGELVAGGDAQPLSGQYPTSIWSSGERILDPHQLNLPTDLIPGQYRLALGLYYQPTGDRVTLRLADGSSPTDNRLELGLVLTIVLPAN